MPSIHFSFRGRKMTAIESNYILSRVHSSLNDAFERTYWSLELKRQEKRRRRSSSSSSAAYSHGLNLPNLKEVSQFKNKLIGSLAEKTQNEMSASQELESWIKKMKCSGNGGGMKLEHFPEIKVGVCTSDVIYGSPSLEPYPHINEEKCDFKGRKDSFGRWTGKGVINFENGDSIIGYFKDGLRHGECKIETSRHQLRAIVGEYKVGKLNGKAKMFFDDNSMMEGYFVDGVLHGFARIFDEKGRLSFCGHHQNGRPYGVCWKITKGSGCVVGRVNKEGELSGFRLAYIYPDFYTALIGTFKQGVLESGRSTILKTLFEDNGVKVPIFEEASGPLHVREISSYEFMTSYPLLRDPYEDRYVYIKTSKVSGAHEGLFAKRKIEAGTLVAFYNGKPLKPKSSEDVDYDDWNYNAYKIFDPARKNGTLDIPYDYRCVSNYVATSAHKTNHSFLPNAEFVTFDHPKFGLIPSLISIHEIQMDEEIFVHYGYDLEGSPDWYEKAWLEGTYPVPDSLKNGWIIDSSKSKLISLPEKLTPLTLDAE